MFGAFGKALEQLPDPRFMKVVILGIAGAILTLAALWTASGWALQQVKWTQLWLIGDAIAWLGDYADDIGWVSFALGAGGLTWLLFPVAAVAVIGLFLDSVCEAVEAKHYPTLGTPRPQPVLEAVFGAIRFLGVTIAVNLIALPFYLLLLVLFGTGAFLFLIVNGYLVGREFFELVAARRLPPGPARRLRKAHGTRILIFGTLAVFLMSIPVVNLVAPVIAAAAMVHLYQSLPRRAEFESAPH
ncbi:hypothetical protein HH303_10835 [Rhodospirillaceae bacterium KN72]|uniref:CysZ-like protein n=1 Tax=Pacificispira spongiicola TaxID=2729598 RepID=A0A7Y0HER0_9PROT|nr:EI24 domain-containing protein [Pacificispira spongiicola]NMM44975.1 hypothetical protein [Pacificispira spongiicola]